MPDERKGKSHGTEFWAKTGQYLAGLGSERVMEEGAWGVYPLEIRVKMPGDTSGEFMVIAKGMGPDGGRVVAFHSAPDLNSAVQGCLSRWQNASLKWREDKPFPQK